MAYTNEISIATTGIISPIYLFTYFTVIVYFQAKAFLTIRIEIKGCQLIFETASCNKYVNLIQIWNFKLLS